MPKKKTKDFMRNCGRCKNVFISDFKHPSSCPECYSPKAPRLKTNKEKCHHKFKSKRICPKLTFKDKLCRQHYFDKIARDM